jgi:hypothetical protein
LLRFFHGGGKVSSGRRLYSGSPPNRHLWMQPTTHCCRDYSMSMVPRWCCTRSSGAMVRRTSYKKCSFASCASARAGQCGGLALPGCPQSSNQ